MTNQRDLEREWRKVISDVNGFRRSFDYHFLKLQGYFGKYKRDLIVDWAGHVMARPDTALLIVESCGTGRTYSNEALRISLLDIQSGKTQDWLFAPREGNEREVEATTYYHGLTMAMLEGRPKLIDLWESAIKPEFEQRYIVPFSLEHVGNVLPSWMGKRMCLHDKCREYFDEYHDVSLQRVMEQLGIPGIRPSDSLERLHALKQVVIALSEGRNLLPLRVPDTPDEVVFEADKETLNVRVVAEDDDLGSLDDQPF